MEYLVKDIEDVERICRAHGKHVIFLMSIDGHSEFVLSGVTFDSYDVDEIGYSFSATAENYCQVMPEEINRYKEGEGEIILYGRGKKIPIFYQCINIKNGY